MDESRLPLSLSLLFTAAVAKGCPTRLLTAERVEIRPVEYESNPQARRSVLSCHKSPANLLDGDDNRLLL